MSDDLCETTKDQLPDVTIGDQFREGRRLLMNRVSCLLEEFEARYGVAIKSMQALRKNPQPDNAPGVLNPSSEDSAQVVEREVTITIEI